MEALSDLLTAISDSLEDSFADATLGADSLLEVLTDLPDVLVARALQVGLKIPTALPRERTRILAWAASRLEPTERARLLKTLLESAGEQSPGVAARIVAAAAPFITEDLMPQAQAIALVAEYPADRAEAIGALASEAPSKERMAALESLVRDSSALPDGEQAQVMESVARYLPEPLLDKAVSNATQIVDSGARDWALGALAVQLPGEKADEALELARGISDEFRRAGLLAEIGRTAPTGVLGDIDLLTTDDAKASLLVSVIPVLSREHLPAAMRLSLPLRGLARARVLTELGKATGGMTNRYAGALAMEDMKQAEGEYGRAEALKEIATTFGGGVRERAISELVALAPTERAIVMVRLVEALPESSEAFVESALEGCLSLDNDFDFLRETARLIPYLPDAGRQHLAERAAHSADEIRLPLQALLLRHTVGRDNSLVSELAAAALAHPDPIVTGRTIEALLPAMEEGQIEETLHTIESMDNDDTRSEALGALAEHLPPKLNGRAIEIARSLTDLEPRRSVLSRLLVAAAVNGDASTRSQFLSEALETELKVPWPSGLGGGPGLGALGTSRLAAEALGGLSDEQTQEVVRDTFNRFMPKAAMAPRRSSMVGAIAGGRMLRKLFVEPNGGDYEAGVREEALIRAPKRKPARRRVSGPPPPSAPRRAHARLECPTLVVMQEEFELKVGLAKEKGTGVTGEDLVVPQDVVGDYELTVRITADGFSLREKESWRVKMPVTSEKPYPFVTLHVKPDFQAQSERALAITADYSVAGQPMGSAERTVLVAQSAEIAKTLTKPRKKLASSVNAVAGGKAPDLTIYITEPDDRPGYLRWKFDTPYELDIDDTALFTPVGENSSPADFAEHLISGVEAAQAGTLLDLELGGIGASVADAMSPQVWAALKTIRERDVTDRRLRVLIMSEEPYIPWELATMPEPIDKGAPPFLGAQVVVGRWVKSTHKPPPCGPVKVGKAPMQVVSGIYANRRLKRAEEEAAALIDTYKATRVDASDLEIGKCLRDTDACVIHFAMHGRYAPEGSSEGLLTTDGTYISPDHVKVAGLRSAPVVFLNACQVGSNSKMLGDYAGMSANFLYAGASAVVAPLWSVGDETAKDVALEFYRLAFAGEAPAEIIMQERAKIKLDANLKSATLLAYQFFGHPWMTIG
jgi:hypothetical protein